MRNLKFRAWDIKNKKMITDFIDFGERAFLNRSGELVHYNQYILMQFTGLLDKESKEIWEGDIYKHSDDTIHTIYFEESQACFRMKEIGACRKWYLGENLRGEVLGNIYENPELMEGK